MLNTNSLQEDKFKQKQTNKKTSPFGNTDTRGAGITETDKLSSLLH